MQKYFKSYKGRMVRVGEVVEVYRNLNVSDCFSIRSVSRKQVVAHCSSVTLTDCEFIVMEGGRQYTLRHQQKQVHAFVRGKIVGINEPCSPSLDQTVSYNPYEQNTFFTLETQQPVKTAGAVHCEGKYCRVSASEQSTLEYTEQYGLLLEA